MIRGPLFFLYCFFFWAVPLRDRGTSTSTLTHSQGYKCKWQLTFIADGSGGQGKGRKGGENLGTWAPSTMSNSIAVEGRALGMKRPKPKAKSRTERQSQSRSKKPSTLSIDLGEWLHSNGAGDEKRRTGEPETRRTGELVNWRTRQCHVRDFMLIAWALQ